MTGKQPTKDERERWEAFAKIGCIACYLEGMPFRKFERHHIVEGYRLGHRFSLPLCRWHHRGELLAGTTVDNMTNIYGPSLHHSKKRFVEVYGSERELCERVDRLIGWPAPVWPVSKVVPR